MNNGQNNEGVHAGHKEIADEIWAGEYFGPDGAVALAGKAYIGSVSLRNTDKERANLALMYASTLYSAIGNCVAQVKKFRFEFLSIVDFLLIGIELLWHLNKVISRILYEMMYIDFDASQKQALMAYLLICRWVHPFGGYRKMAIKIGEDVRRDYDMKDKKLGEKMLSDYPSEHLAYLFVIARLSRLFFYPQRKLLRGIVLWNIRSKIQQIKFGWRNINSLARLIGDKEMKEYSAPLADSKDVMIKSGI